jgi:Fic family protein
MDWRTFTWDSPLQQEMLQRVEEKYMQLRGMRPISGAALARLRDSFAMEWTYHSNSIEGNTLTLQETRLVLEDGITVGGKSLREHFEILNHHDAISFIEKQAQKGYKLNAGDILSVHALVLQRIEKEFGGRYRNSGVRIMGANFTPPNALKVEGLMEELLSWINAEQNLPLPVKATIFHHRFVWIHPFFDGNGRTVRLLFNLLLMSEGYPPAIILQQDRKKYYDALNKANNGSYEKLVTLILQALERSLDIYISQLNNTYEDFRPISSIVEEEKLPYGQEYISLLVRKGKIAGYKEGKSWLTTEDAILSYMQKRKRSRKTSK